MDQVIRAHMTAMEDEVKAAAIPDSCKHTAAWCIGQLPALYTKLRQTSESRYGDEISRLIKGVLKELFLDKKAKPEGHKLATALTDRLCLLHEELGLPSLDLKAPAVSASRSRKAG
jgi:hypothetical protein